MIAHGRLAAWPRAAGLVVLLLVAGLSHVPVARATGTACYPSNGRLQVTAGHATSTALSCADGAGTALTPQSLRQDHPVTGITLAITRGPAPGSFALTITAAADMAPDSYNFPVVIDVGGGAAADFRIVVEVVEEPAPRCSTPREIAAVSSTGPITIAGGCSAPGGSSAAPTLDVIEAPRHGKLTLVDGGHAWSYLPDPGYVGHDHFTFRAKNQFGSSPVSEVRITVRSATAAELSAVYAAPICTKAAANTFCRPGEGRHAFKGTVPGFVSHRHWPAITGVIISVRDGQATLSGGSEDDELLGHHGSDRLFGRAGSDVLWGDRDPLNNNARQRDLLSGGPGSDFIYTSHGRNTVTGGTGNDFIWAFYGHGTINCGPGVDTVRLSGRSSAYRLRSCERRGTF